MGILTTMSYPSDENLKSAYCDRSAYKRIRSERNYPFKKRKFLHYSSVSNSDGGISSEGISNSPEQSINGNASGIYPKMRGGDFHTFSPLLFLVF